MNQFSQSGETLEFGGFTDQLDVMNGAHTCKCQLRPGETSNHGP
jgi:hypothetical protein